MAPADAADIKPRAGSCLTQKFRIGTEQKRPRLQGAMGRLRIFLVPECLFVVVLWIRLGHLIFKAVQALALAPSLLLILNRYFAALYFLIVADIRQKTFYIETFGCQMNVHDSEKVIGT